MSDRTRPRIADEWRHAESLCVPAGASAGQRADMRTMFYMGAVARFGLLTHALDADNQPTAADVAYVEGLQAELQAYAAQFTAAVPPTSRH